MKGRKYFRDRSYVGNAAQQAASLNTTSALQRDHLCGNDWARDLSKVLAFRRNIAVCNARSLWANYVRLLLW